MTILTGERPGLVMQTWELEPTSLARTEHQAGLPQRRQQLLFVSYQGNMQPPLHTVRILDSALLMPGILHSIVPTSNSFLIILPQAFPQHLR